MQTEKFRTESAQRTIFYSPMNVYYTLSLQMIKSVVLIGACRYAVVLSEILLVGGLVL